MLFWVWGVIFALVGLLMLLKPDCIWSISEEWKSDSADGPSDLYVLSTKIGGIVFLVVAAFCIVTAILY